MPDGHRQQWGRRHNKTVGTNHDAVAANRIPKLDTRIAGFAYGIIPNPVDGSIWIARTQPVPGQLVRLELGSNPPETCKAEVYEPPFQNDAVPADEWGFCAARHRHCTGRRHLDRPFG